MRDAPAPPIPWESNLGLKAIGVTLCIAVLLTWTSGITAGAQAQSVGDPPSVMDRIRDKARQRQPATIADWFQRLDTNQDNRVSREELQISINRRFGILDANRNGSISGDEFRARGTVPGGQSGPSFDQMDINRNGELSVIEFSAPVLWRFARLDSDGDGFLSRMETARYLNTPASRALPPLPGRCFEVDGRVVIVAPERADAFEKTGRQQTDCSWQPGTLPVR
ncbi:MAG: Ca2+-binding EF-hand superfamily protein [Paracoccaceae bacterium]|jgi:Ca2+-binding EF-hand superfamily protein